MHQLATSPGKTAARDEFNQLPPTQRKSHDMNTPQLFERCGVGGVFWRFQASRAASLGRLASLRNTTGQQRIVKVSCTTADTTLNNPRSSVPVASVWPQI